MHAPAAAGESGDECRKEELFHQRRKTAGTKY
jgi:hypothetical protein